MILNLHSTYKQALISSTVRWWLGPGSASTPSKVHKAGARHGLAEHRISRQQLPPPLLGPELSHSHTNVQCFLIGHCRSPCLCVGASKRHRYYTLHAFPCYISPTHNSSQIDDVETKTWQQKSRTNAQYLEMLFLKNWDGEARERFAQSSWRKRNQ